MDELKEAKMDQERAQANEELQKNEDIDDPEDSDWSADSDPGTSNLSSEGDDADENVAAKLKQQIVNLESQQKELQSLKNDICKKEQAVSELVDVNESTHNEHMSSELPDERANQPVDLQSLVDKTNEKLQSANDTIGTLEASIELLENKISKLQEDNEELRKQIDSHECPIPIPIKQTELDEELVRFVEEHNEELTLDFLKCAYDTLLEMKVSNPDKDFRQYISDMKNGSSGYVEEFERLQTSKKALELKLQLMTKRYEEELSAFNETKVEHIFKNSGAKEYLERLRASNKIKEDDFRLLKTELEYKSKEISELHDKTREMEKKLSHYLAQLKREQLEAEKKANERDRRLALNANLQANLSSSSSYVENQIPPPPPIQVPSMDEFLRMGTSSQDSFPFNSLGLDSAIPPPPPIDVPFEEILLQVKNKPNSSIV